MEHHSYASFSFLCIHSNRDSLRKLPIQCWSAENTRLRVARIPSPHSMKEHQRSFQMTDFIGLLIDSPKSVATGNWKSQLCLKHQQVELQSLLSHSGDTNA